jgi:hypothetical protein
MSFWVDFLGLGQAEIGVLRLGLTKLLTKNIIIIFAYQTDSLFSCQRGFD